VIVGEAASTPLVIVSHLVGHITSQYAKPLFFELLNLAFVDGLTPYNMGKLVEYKAGLLFNGVRDRADTADGQPYSLPTMPCCSQCPSAGVGSTKLPESHLVTSTQWGFTKLS
jgi:hypothetical protein